ncbi:MAG: restriction endonuclease [Myxococcales bacterium]|nr:restriction endonuclease [Myxococcales bacterium]
MGKDVYVTKADGELEPLDLTKLKHSLARSGAAEALVERVARRVASKVENGIPTEKLYRLAFRQLRKERRHISARYSLKRAVMQLGPTGYPFERLIAAILSQEGWRTEVGVNLQGAVNHEIDVLAEYASGDESHRLLVECKHKMSGDAKCDVKTALYVSARARDLLGDLHGNSDQFWLVTNGRFTADAVVYAKSVHLGLLSWDLPKSPPINVHDYDRKSVPPPAAVELDLPQRNLAQRITDELAFPITCLTSLKQRHKQQLLDDRIVLCRELDAHPELLQKLRLDAAQRTEVRRELFDLLHPLTLEPSPPSTRDEPPGPELLP